MTDTPKGLRYTGGGYGGWLPGVPARDLAPDEVAEHGESTLLAAGIYTPFTPAQDKRLSGPTQTKVGDA